MCSLYFKQHTNGVATVTLTFARDEGQEMGQRVFRKTPSFLFGGILKMQLQKHRATQYSFSNSYSKPRTHFETVL